MTPPPRAHCEAQVEIPSLLGPSFLGVRLGIHVGLFLCRGSLSKSRARQASKALIYEITELYGEQITGGDVPRLWAEPAPAQLHRFGSMTDYLIFQNLDAAVCVAASEFPVAMIISKFLLPLTALPPRAMAEPVKPASLPLANDAQNSFLQRRNFIFETSIASTFVALFSATASTEGAAPSENTFLSGIANTKSWFLFYGDGFAIRVPPDFQDIMEPEDFNSGLSLYGDKAKPKTYAARFASSDGSEFLSVVIRPSNQLKITFLEAKDIADLGSLREAARIFVPGGATLYTARTIKIKEDDGYRNYYYYEFGRDEEHAALVAAVNSGKAVVVGATAPQKKWEEDGVKLRSAAISLTLL